MRLQVGRKAVRALVEHKVRRALVVLKELLEVRVQLALRAHRAQLAAQT